MNCFFQLVAQESGVRSKPVFADRRKFADKLLSLYPSGSPDYVLVLVENPVEGADWDFSVAPLLTISHFCSLFCSETSQESV